MQNLFRKSIVELVSPDLTCLAGKLALDGFITKRRNGATTEELEKTIINVCVTLNIESEEVCRGAVTINMVSHSLYFQNTTTIVQLLGYNHIRNRQHTKFGWNLRYCNCYAIFWMHIRSIERLERRFKTETRKYCEKSAQHTFNIETK